jgi:hypothetical protein
VQKKDEELSENSEIKQDVGADITGIHGQKQRLLRNLTKI